MSTAATFTQEDLERITRENVERGVQLLNEHLGPDWPNLVTVAELDLASPRFCVLGQTFEGKEATEAQMEHARAMLGSVIDYDEPYWQGLAILDGEAMTTPGRYGFNTDSSLASMWWEANNDYKDLPDVWGVLQEAWEERLAELKAALEARA